ncbi:MAG: sortase [Candidatus Levybacteria bacterium]|nr:sortase [Candidatus Levybacteria bacterium]
MRTFASIPLFTLGILFILFGFYLVYLRYSPKSLAFENTTLSANSSHTTLPYIIKIPSINVTLPIVPSKIENNKWETTSHGVSFLTQSSKPGNPGNSVYYGHNWGSILGNLTKVKPKDTIEITMSTGKTYTYEVEYTAIVDPTQTSVIHDAGDTRVTIYTCTGFLDTKRFVVVAKPTD